MKRQRAPSLTVSLHRATLNICRVIIDENSNEKGKLHQRVLQEDF